MIRQYLHVVVVCDHCLDGLTDNPTGPTGDPFWFTGRPAALDALTAALTTGGWVRLFDGALLCPICAAAQTCRDRGHDYAVDGWRMCACDRSIPAHADALPDPAGGEGCGMTWRLCGRCDHIDEHHITDTDTDTDTDACERDGRGGSVQVQPGGFLRQDVPAGLALPTHSTHPIAHVGTGGHESSGEALMLRPITTHPRTAGAGVGGAP